MSKLARSLLSLCLTTAVAAGLATAQMPAPAPAATAAPAGGVRELAVSAELLDEVARLRGLAVLRGVPSGLKSRSDIESLVLKDISENATPAELADASSLLRFLGLVEEGFDLERETVALLTEQIAGFYDPRTRNFYLADWIPLDEQRTVIVHEMTHALADQHFDLRRFEKWPDGDADAELAARALVEGDATALMIAFMLQERGLPHDLGRIPFSLTEMLRQSVSAPDAERPVFAKTPVVLRESLQFPYVYGAGLVQRLLREGSWARVSDAYRALPASTEQVLHPEKYLAGEPAVHVELPDLAAALGEGWRRVDTDVNGEFGYRLILGSQLGEREAAEAAAGWGGDRYAFYLDRARRAPLFVHVSVWDSEAEAGEFFSAYAERTRRRFKAEGDGRSGPNVRLWRTPEGLVRIERSGTRVVAVEGFRGADVAPLLARLRR